MSDKNADGFMMIEGLPESVGTKEVAFQNPVILDITADVNGRVVQWNGEVWLLYDSEEAIQFRNKCLKEFRERRNHLELLERYIWNRAIEAAASKADEAGYEPIAEVIRDLKK